MAIVPQQNPNDLMGQLQQLLGGGGFGVNQAASPAPQAGGIGFNLGTGQLALQGLGALGNFWNAREARNMARDQFDFAKGIANTNINNSIQSYNTALEDRLRARGATEGSSDSAVADQIARNRLTR